MADLDWFQDVLPDRTRFPDSTQWTTDDGNVVTLGALRQQEALRQRAYQERYNMLLQEKAEADRLIRERVLATAPAAPTAASGQPDDFYANDPILGPVWRENQATKAEIGSVKQTLTNLEKILQGMQAWPGQMAVVLKTQQLQQRDQSVNLPKVIETATELQKKAAMPGALLDEAYRLTTWDQQMAAAKEAGMAEGKAAAEAEAAAALTAPFQPWGPTSVALPTGTPAFENDTAMLQAIYADPDMHRVWQGTVATLPLQ